jgi:hypothetical protein
MFRALMDGTTSQVSELVLVRRGLGPAAERIEYRDAIRAGDYGLARPS